MAKQGDHPLLHITLLYIGFISCFPSGKEPIDQPSVDHIHADQSDMSQLI